MKRIQTLVAVGLVGLAAALGFYLAAPGPDARAPASSPVAIGQDTPEPGLPASSDNRYPSRLIAADSVEIPQRPPASLAGTDVPGGWDITDANGSLVPTPALRQLFEHYLAALGEETLPQLVARIENTLSELPEPARSEAIETLGAYLDYKLELGELEAASAEPATLDPDRLAQTFVEIRSLRRRWLDADTADAFFATEEAVDDFQLARIRIRADDSLSDEARAARLQEAEQSLPPPIREARQQTRKFSEYQQVRERLSDDPQALQAWREQAFGSKAAGRLAQVEADQQAWDKRWQAYEQEKAELEKLGLAGPERETAIQRLREQYFEGPERYRAEALDSLQ